MCKSAIKVDKCFPVQYVHKMVMLRELFLSRVIFSSLLRKYKYVIPSATAVSRKNYSTSVESEENYDIIISGGGMVGTTLACCIG